MLITGAVNVVLGIPSTTAVLYVAVLIDNTVLGPADYEFAANREAGMFLGVLALAALIAVFSAVNIGLQRWLTGFRPHLWAVALLAFLQPTIVTLLAS
ncbi:hypothetical protein [Nocardioides deserti]|uniref:Uncharacterized protein n=1 Tax=Nocardioides deserti TaxID=1588644 RepID=A0ABR6UD40_9ACTN|nr:hypothetical protein [Nocardioides deserti]MBC2962377.1 hypothetical protein [Nocardioides deserti]